MLNETRPRNTFKRGTFMNKKLLERREECTARSTSTAKPQCSRSGANAISFARSSACLRERHCPPTLGKRGGRVTAAASSLQSRSESGSGASDNDGYLGPRP